MLRLSLSDLSTERVLAFLNMIETARNGKLGLREVASAAQFSVATVSRVLNGSNRASATEFSPTTPTASRTTKTAEPPVHSRSSPLQCFMMLGRASDADKILLPTLNE